MSTVPEPLSPGDDPGAAARGLNELLRSLGYTEDAITVWWNHVGHAELGGRTALQAWQREEYDAVIALVQAKAADCGDREWADQVRAEAAAGGFKARLASQVPLRGLVERWRSPS
jgi:hypothetical protein